MTAWGIGQRDSVIGGSTTHIKPHVLLTSTDELTANLREHRQAHQELGTLSPVPFKTHKQSQC